MPASLLIAGMARFYGCPAITSDLASVNQRLMSPSSGDLAEWLCKAFARVVEWLAVPSKVFRTPTKLLSF